MEVSSCVGGGADGAHATLAIYGVGEAGGQVAALDASLVAYQ